MFDGIENENEEQINKKYGIGKLKDRYSLSFDFSIKKIVFPLLSGLLFIGIFIINIIVSDQVIKKNEQLNAEYNSLLKEVPKKEMEKYISFKKEIDSFEKEKTGISYFEIFEFLSRIIPTNNRESKIVIDGKIIDFTYTTDSVEHQLAFENTLSQLKERGLILDFKSTKYQDKTLSQNNGVTTFYRSVIPLTIGGNGNNLTTNNIRKFLIDNPKYEKKQGIYKFNKDKMIWEKSDEVEINVGGLSIPEVKKFVEFKR